MLKVVAKYIIGLILLVGVSALSYYKGYCDYRVQHLYVNMLENYATLKALDDSNNKLAKSDLYVVLSGQADAYNQLLRSVIIDNSVQRDPTASKHLEDINQYLKAKRPEMFPESSPDNK